MEIKRKCSMCGSYLPISEFRWKKNKNNYYSYCKNCERLYTKEYMRIYRERKRGETNEIYN